MSQYSYPMLSDQEKSKGFVRPLRYTYFHPICSGTTMMSDEVAATFAKDPKFHVDLYCYKCKQNLKVNEFLWSGSNAHVGS